MAKANENSEFELMRERLLNQYHSENITHSGFIIALIIGAFSVIANYKDFFYGGTFGILLFYSSLCAIIAIGCYVVGRLFYWTSLTNAVLTMTENQFKQYKKEIQQKFKDGKIPIASERADIAHMQNYGKKRMEAYNVNTLQVILAKFSPLRLTAISIIVGMVCLAVLLLFNQFSNIFF